MPELARLSARIEADTSPLEAGLHKAGGLIGNFGGALAGVGNLAFTGLIAGAAGVVGGLGVATKSASDFQSQISGIAAVGGPEAVAQMDAISAKALQVGKDTSFSASEAASGMEELIKAGVSIGDVLGGATDATVALAAATGVNLATAAEIASNAMNQFNLKGAEVGNIADIVAGAANASAIDVNDFKFSLASVGAVANTVGFSFKDTATAIAEMGQAGIKGSDAGTSLKTMFLNLQPHTAGQTAEFTKLGLITADAANTMKEAEARGLSLGGSLDDVSQRLFKSVTGWTEGTKVTEKQGKAWQAAQQELHLTSNAFFDAAGNVKSMAEVQGILANATKDLTSEQKIASLQTLFGTDAVRAAAVMAKLGAQGFEDMAGAMGKVSAADVAKTRLDNLNGSIEALKGSLETAGIILGTAFLPALNMLVKAGTDVLNANMPFIEQIGKQLPGLLANLGTKLTIAGVALGYLGKAFAGQADAATAFKYLVGELLGTDALDGLADFLGVKLPPVLQWLATTGWPALSAAMLAAGTFVMTTLIPALSTVVAWLGTNIPPVITWLTTTGWPALVTAATAVSTWWTSTGQPAFAAIVAFLGTNLPPVLTWISATGWPAIVTAGQAVATKVQEVQTNFGLLVTEMDKRGVFTDLQQIWNDLTTVAGLFTTELGHSTEGMTSSDGKAAILSATIQGAATSFKQVSGDIASATGALKAFAQWCADAKEKLGALIGLMNANAGIIEQGQAAARLLGINIPRGAAQGVREGTPEFTAAVGDMSQQGVDVLRDSWEAHSPSQVAADMGFNIALGLAQGIAKGDSVVAQSVLAITKNAIKNNIDPLIALALAKAESGFNPNAVGDSGASVGLFQLHERGQGAGMSGAERANPWVNASKFLGAHGELFQQLKASGLAGDELAKVFGRLAEGSDPQFAERYAQAYRDLVAQFGATASASMAMTKATTAVAATQQQGVTWAQTMAAQQAALTQTLEGQAPAMRNTKDALAAFSSVLGPIERQVAGGSIGLETLEFKMVDLARATGLATKPWDDYNAGLIDIDEAMHRVISQSADAGPQFDELRKHQDDVGRSTRQNALDFLQLALNAGKAPPALAAVSQAVVAAGAALVTATTPPATAGQKVDALGNTWDTTKASTDLATGAMKVYQETINTLDPKKIAEMTGAWDTGTEAVKKFADAAHQIGDYLDGHEFHFKAKFDDVPDDYKPGSPSPLEIALEGIARAGRGLSDLNISPSFDAPSLARSSVGSVGGGSRGGDTYNFTFPNYVGSKAELIETVHQGLLKKKRGSGRLGLGDKD